MDVEVDIGFDSRVNRQLPPRNQGRARDEEVADAINTQTGW